MTVFVTQYDAADPNRRCLSDSVDSGFGSLDDVVAAMGEPWKARPGVYLLYPGGVAFSTFAFYLTPPSDDGQNAAK